MTFARNAVILIEKKTITEIKEKRWQRSSYAAFAADDAYVFIPACCYARNSFRTLKYTYPPMFRPQDGGVDIPGTITNVPRLEPYCSGKIEVTTGDAATPCVGVFSKKEKKSMLVFTVRQIGGRNIGLSMRKGKSVLLGRRDMVWDASEEDSEDSDSHHILPEGFINERVNMFDWEDDCHIGGVFNGSCWSETSNMLALAEVIPELECI